MRCPDACTRWKSATCRYAPSRCEGEPTPVELRRRRWTGCAGRSLRRYAHLHAYRAGYPGNLRDDRGQKPPAVTVLPLFARLSAKDQARVFSTPVGRKIIVATNIAETSLTIPGVKYVIDTGLARISQYNPRSRTTSLQVRPISRSSADQRKALRPAGKRHLHPALFRRRLFVPAPVYAPGDPESQPGRSHSENDGLEAGIHRGFSVYRPAGFQKHHGWV